jgi:DNA ligase (NAD+)
VTTRERAAKRIAALREEIRRHEHLYYALNRPEISDQEYDALERELRDLEAQHPDLVTPDSPTQRVGEKPSEGFPTVVHRTTSCGSSRSASSGSWAGARSLTWRS